MDTDNLFSLLPLTFYPLLPDKISELRMRVGKPLYCFDGGKWFFVREGDKPYVVTGGDVAHVLGRASGYSLYSVTDNLVKGFITWKGGIRIGVTGECVSDGDAVFNVKYPTSLAIRIPCEIKGQADELIGKIVEGRKFRNTMIVSPPAGGKTTLLREIARAASVKGLNVAVIDERGEIAAVCKGEPTLDTGPSCDVITGVSKTRAFEMLVRSMNPDAVITDEIYGEKEVNAVLDAMRAGVGVAISVHAETVGELKDTVYEKLQKAMDVTVVLSKKKRPGEIAEIIEKC
ncbi:MAG: hypothetical protein SOX04_03215 [Eubacteriales bacterium]|nr:hypothetical protein [Christensenellaceae bacterium]MDY3241540.1 hypothetical protein [Eubacteriales bacterium]